MSVDDQRGFEPASDAAFLEVQRFLNREAALLDRRDYTAWFDLLTEDVKYVVTARVSRPAETGPLDYAIIDEDADTLRLRVLQIGDPRLTRLQAEVLEELPEAVDLLRLAISSGLNVHLAVAAVGERLCGPVGIGLVGASWRVRSGMRLADALETLPDSVGEPVRPLVRVLVDGDRYGTDLETALEQLAADSRLLRRRRAEENARRLPLRLLFPLVICILPAFILLTLAPVLAETLTAFRQ